MMEYEHDKKNQPKETKKKFNHFSTYSAPFDLSCYRRNFPLDEKTILYRFKGKTTKELKQHKIDEFGNIPIMMYHLKYSKTTYTGGNVDIDGHQQTAEAFRKDLEFYYENDDRMVRLQDSIHGTIDVELGKSPLCLTFDDETADFSVSQNIIKIFCTG
ncbi:hypothetical protein [Faecalicoccus pleomorphus]|uniref:hypothetical protein n=1 Tax=Faecalicoccus pleomorphus TaxID=1323 RepID=UPI0039F52E02